MANIEEKPNSMKAGNLNSHPNYLITIVRMFCSELSQIFKRSKLKNQSLMGSNEKVSNINALGDGYQLLLL